MAALQTTTVGTITICRVALGTLGLSRRALRAVYAFRRQLEQECVDRLGGLTPAGAKRLHTACCALAEVLRAQATLSAAQRGEIKLTLEGERWEREFIGKNNERCDRALAAMGLPSAHARRDDGPWVLFDQEVQQRLADTPPSAQAGAPSPSDSDGRPDARLDGSDAPTGL